jgi:hypothetical protein
MVRERRKPRLPQPGDRVRVPFGLRSRVEGRVLRNDGVTSRSIDVEFEIDGADGTFISSFEPADVEVIRVA